jgi:hypothetical protein
MKLVMTPALTPALSLGERVSIGMSLDNCFVPVAVSASVLMAWRCTTTASFGMAKKRRTIPPLSGERAGVRAGVKLLFH